MAEISREEYGQRYERVRTAMDRERLDAVIAYSTAKVQANVRYLAGYFVRWTGMQSSPDGSYHMFGACACLFPAEGEASVRTDQPWDIVRAKEVSLFHDTEFTSNFGKDLGQLARSRGYKRVGIDNWYLFPARDYVEFREEAPDVEIRPTHLLAEARRVKSPAEIEIMRRAAKVADEAAHAAAEAVEIGKTEYEVALVAEFKLLEGGELAVASHTISGCGVNTASGTQTPTREKKIRPGEWVMFDITPRVDGYCSDISRMRLAGDLSDLDPKLRRLYEANLLINQEVIKAVRPGVSGRYLNDLAAKIADQEGVKEYKSGLLGHGVGLDIHDIPDYWYDDSPWSAGEVNTIEPAFFIPGLGGTRIEDTVLVTDHGCEPLTKLEKKLVVG